MPRTAAEIVRTYHHLQQTTEKAGTYLSAYSNELSWLSCVMNGNIKEMEKRLATLSGRELLTGSMSQNPLRQALFTLVSGVTLITRFAIAGGLSEYDAYLLSDAYLSQADKLNSPEEILKLIPDAIRRFTIRVHETKLQKYKSYPVTRCVLFIGDHLHHPITLTDAASYCKVTPQYLSALFHKETGMTVTEYIRKEKLKTAAQMLSQSDYSIQRIADFLAFGSASQFCAQFKKQYGVTPLNWRKNNTHELMFMLP